MSFDELKYIHHIADIHIRNLKRHREYKQVFVNLYEQIKRQTEDSIIYVGGDICHAKTEMSPELIELTSEFLTNLADILPTVVITGNHDANLNNANRLDALTPIIKNLRHPNLHYLKSGGIYRLADVSLVVMSILDSPDKYKKASEVDGDFKIVFYHGSVHNSFTDTGYQLKNDQITTDLFSGYDLGLLGDIHKRQFLDPNETIAYCGSLIQQNHGEKLGHGYLLWDIQKKKSTYIDVKNEYGYYTLDIDKGIIPLSDDIPLRARLRLRFSETDSADRKTIMATLRKQNPKLADLTYSTANIFSRSHLRNRDSVIDLGDVSNPKYQNDLIIDYLNRNFELDDLTSTQIQKLNIELNTKLPVAEVIRNVIWKPKNFKFSNMFSYGEGNEIDFEKMKGVIGVFAPNAQGKSSILDALSYCQFDKSSRAYKSINVMNNKKKKFTSVSNFEINGRDYFIERTATKNKKGDAPVKVNFYYKGKNGREYSLNGDQRHSTNRNIREYIGTYEDFTLTALSTQRQVTSFIDMKQSDRKDLLAQFLDVKIFDTLFELANEKIKKVHTLLKEFQKRDFDKELANTENLLEEARKEYDEIKSEKTKLNRIEKRLTKRLLDLAESLIKIEKISEDINSLLKKKSNNEKSINTSNISIHEQEEKYVKIKTEINSLKEDMIKDMVGVEDKYKHYQKILQSREIIQQEIEKLKIQVKNKLGKLSNLEDFRYDPECEYCMDNPFVKEAIEIRENIDKDKLTAKEFVGRADMIDDEIQANEYIVEKYKKYQEIMNLLRGLEQHSKEILYDKTRSLRGLEKSKNLLQANKIAIDKYYENENAIKHNTKIKLFIDEVSDEYKITTNQLSIVDDKVMDLHGQIQVDKNQRKNILKSIDEAKDLEEQYVAYQYYMEAVKRDGVPYELISKTIPTIEAEINNILSQITDFGIILQVDGKNINAFIAYDENNVWPIELVSGFERFVSLIAIRVAFLNISSLPRPNFLAIDEGFGSLDSENINSMYLLFDYLKTQFDFVMVISHLDSLRDMVDEILEIKKVKGFSQVKYL